MKRVKVEKIMKRQILICAASILVFLNCPDAKAQTAPSDPPYEVYANEGACELNRAYLDMLLIKAKESDDIIFVISSLAQKENFRLNRVRLAEAVRALTIGKVLPSSRVVAATGSRLTSKGPGKLEFYLGGKLFLVSFGKKNSSICLSCCPV